MKNKLPLLSFFAVLLLFAGCKQYGTIRYSRATVFQKKPVQERIKEYDIYVHDNSGETYRVKEPEITENVLIGTPEKIADSLVNKGDLLNDIHVYLNESEVIDEGKQQFDNQNVRYVNMQGSEKKEKNRKFFGIILILLLIPITLIIALAVAIDGSDSGGSDSGGSDSGCYVATMSYGSYGAPQVLVLREFRDRFLQKFGAGRAFIRWYYKNSPSFVEKHRNKKWLHSTLRLPLNALVFVLKPIYSGKNAKK